MPVANHVPRAGARNHAAEPWISAAVRRRGRARPIAQPRDHFDYSRWMPADPRDDFRPFAASEHMFFGLKDPYATIREEILGVLRQQVPETRLHRIVMRGEPKHLTLGRAAEGEPGMLIVAHFAFCLQATLDVTHDEGREVLPATATFLFCDVDQPGRERMQVRLDVLEDADPAFAEGVFRQRFHAFRGGAAP